ncbi:MAG: flagellar hook-associated protein FlgK [Candidatus Marinimicrobia bacterium]|nr:flagellar hook-associated protein FlgK [Candidatus Neomarinimicrobiota bacterium]
MSSSDLLNISRQAMSNSQAAISVTAKNIANVNTEGYKRRRIDFTGYQSNVGSLGLSMQYGEMTVARIKEQFIDNKIYKENQNLGKYATDNLIYPQIEDIFGEPNDAALNNMYNEYWTAWNKLSIDPESEALRTILVNKGQNLANTFGRIHGDLKMLQNQISLDVQGKVNEANSILGKIDDINGIIQNTYGSAGNDLLDERDMLLEKITKIMEVDLQFETNGVVRITSGGQVVLDNGYQNLLTYDTALEDGFMTSIVKFENGTHRPDILKGELGSLIEMNREIIPDYIDKLNNMAIQITNEVNNIHREGYNLDGVTGVNFFKPNITNAGNFKVNSAVELNTELVATTFTAGESGNGDMARAMADLKFNKFMDGSTLNNYYGNIVTDIGNNVQEAEFLLSSEEKVLINLKNQQDSVSGVSNDEEMTNLIQYQQTYQAAARLVNTSQEMVTVLLNMI